MQRNTFNYLDMNDSKINIRKWIKWISNWEYHKVICGLVGTTTCECNFQQRQPIYLLVNANYSLTTYFATENLLWKWNVMPLVRVYWSYEFILNEFCLVGMSHSCFCCESSRIICWLFCSSSLVTSPCHLTIFSSLKNCSIFLMAFSPFSFPIFHSWSSIRVQMLFRILLSRIKLSQQL